MKRIIPILSILCAFILLLCACNADTVETGGTPSDELVIEGFFGADTAVPDFLTEEQIDLYKQAAVLYYIFTKDPHTIDNFPLKERQEYITPDEGGVTNEYKIINHTTYGKSIGRFREYADFERMVLSIFTLEYFELLNDVNGAFADSNGDLYWLGASGSFVHGYNPIENPDTFQLISKSENEIKFNVIGYYSVYEDGYETGEIESETISIVLTLTDSGWRFSQFVAMGLPFVISSIAGDDSNELNITGFLGADTVVPDFLSEEQADLYRKAAVLYYIIATDPSSIDRFPLKEGQLEITPNDGDVTTEYRMINNMQYGKSIGRYRAYEDFEKLMLSIFTVDFFDKLNVVNGVEAFVESDGALYWLAASGGSRLGYNQHENPDTFHLIINSEDEIRFQVTGYYSVFEDGQDTGLLANEMFQIVLTLTDSGWRFSRFVAMGAPFAFSLSHSSVYETYYDELSNIIKENGDSFYVELIDFDNDGLPEIFIYIDWNKAYILGFSNRNEFYREEIVPGFYPPQLLEVDEWPDTAGAYYTLALDKYGRNYLVYYGFSSAGQSYIFYTVKNGQWEAALTKSNGFNADHPERPDNQEHYYEINGRFVSNEDWDNAAENELNIVTRFSFPRHDNNVLEMLNEFKLFIQAF